MMSGPVFLVTIMAESFDGFTEVVSSRSKKEFISNFLLGEESRDRQHLRWTKTSVTAVMTILVVCMNWMVVSMLNHVIDEEIHLIRNGFMKPEERSITTGVYMALIGGTVAEVSALFFIIVKSMFKSSDD